MYETDSPEQAALREAVRDFCRHHADRADRPAWKRLTGELGLTGLGIDERHGGMGAGIAEIAVAAEELGRVLLPVPYLSTALAGAVLSEGDPEAATGLLPGLASGALTAGFVFTGDITVADGRLSGLAGHVLDGGEAGSSRAGLACTEAGQVVVAATLPGREPPAAGREPPAAGRELPAAGRELPAAGWAAKPSRKIEVMASASCPVV
jgi:alkylation response protein AidB-like acyl-CoA dehydrogenase